MKVISVNIGLPREIFYEGRMILTGIFKAPITGRKDDLAGMGRATDVKALPDGSRDYFRARLEAAAGS